MAGKKRIARTKQTHAIIEREVRRVGLVPGAGMVAKELSAQRATISRAFRRLVASEVMDEPFGVGGGYRLLRTTEGVKMRLDVVEILDGLPSRGGASVSQTSGPREESDSAG